MDIKIAFDNLCRKGLHDGLPDADAKHKAWGLVWARFIFWEVATSSTATEAQRSEARAFMTYIDYLSDWSVPSNNVQRPLTDEEWDAAWARYDAARAA